MDFSIHYSENPGHKKWKSLDRWMKIDFKRQLSSKRQGNKIESLKNVVFFIMFSFFKTAV